MHHKKLIKSFSKRTGLPFEDVERKWERAKKITHDDHNLVESDEMYYSIVIANLKRLLGLKEQYLFSEKLKKLLQES